MSFNKPKLAEMLNESDVEQKLVFPFLVAPKPYGLGLSSAQILSKQNVRKFLIGKGSDQKSYFPDYLIVKASLPLFVVEAKPRGANLEEAFREARLYAAEMNAIFPAGLNPFDPSNGNQRRRLLCRISRSSRTLLKTHLF
jgi:hypothetical protein